MKSVLFFLLVLILSLLFYLASSERFAYLNGRAYQQLGFHFKAAEMFEKACNDGNPRACVDLAAMFETGEGVDKDLVKAKGLYQKAYEHGFAPARDYMEDRE